MQRWLARLWQRVLFCIKMRLSYHWLPAAERLYLGTRNFTTTKAAQGPAGW